MIIDIFEIASQILAIPLVFFLGRFNCSVGWILPLILSSIRNFIRRNREIQQAVSRATSSINERDVIFARLEEVPAWVVFPDVERVEWINTIAKMFWPKVNDLVEKIVRDLEQKINKISSLKTFKFKKIDFGKIVSFNRRKSRSCYK